uniref:DNA-binding protein n=1 Tax=Strongyloides papillosus TaxID=174720 RepID=A0A0N5C6Y3_STREA
MSDLTLVDFLKNVFDNVDNNVRNYPLLIKVLDNVNEGFEVKDNFSKLSRVTIQEIAGEVLRALDENKEAYLNVQSIEIQTKYDFNSNQFYRELHILTYFFIPNKTFTLKNDLHLIDTEIKYNVNTPYIVEDDEKEINDIYTKNDTDNIKFHLYVLVLEKSSLNKRKVDGKYIFNITIIDRNGITINCVHFICESSDEIYRNVNVEEYHMLRLINAGTFTPRNNQRDYMNAKKSLVLNPDKTIFESTEKKFKCKGLPIDFKNLNITYSFF